MLPVTVSRTSSVLPSARASAFGLFHQPLRDAVSPRRPVDEQLRDLASMWLVRRQREVHLDSADESIAVEGGENQPRPPGCVRGEPSNAARASAIENGHM